MLHLSAVVTPPIPPELPDGTPLAAPEDPGAAVAVAGPAAGMRAASVRGEERLRKSSMGTREGAPIADVCQRPQSSPALEAPLAGEY